MDAAQVLGQLSDRRTRLDLLDAPAAPGVYAFFLREGAVPGLHCGSGDCLYIGRSSNLAQREFDTHFRAGGSGFSTLRRSLGALLIDELDLQPQPRSAGTSDTNYRNYRFDTRGEEALSAWMHGHLEVAVFEEADPKSLEHELVVLAGPPLNLTHWPNPDAPMIKAARKRCTDRARASRQR
ncbi:GIY-YIG nuclease family protein [Mycobacterium sp. SMC-15]|uniref:GIY-YIG nuclease family protein n=1 Tax=Mycobacterium sp. SMC-15 TaxID=3381627 RepID=UPI0038776AD1